MPTIPNLIFCNLGFKELKKWVVMWCQWQLSWFGILLMIVNLVVHSSSFHSHSLCVCVSHSIVCECVFIPSWTLYKRRRFRVICLLTDVSSERREREELWGKNVLPLSNHFLYLESLSVFQVAQIDNRLWLEREGEEGEEANEEELLREEEWFLSSSLCNKEWRKRIETDLETGRERKWKKEVERDDGKKTRRLSKKREERMRRRFLERSWEEDWNYSWHFGHSE